LAETTYLRTGGSSSLGNVQDAIKHTDSFPSALKMTEPPSVVTSYQKQPPPIQVTVVVPQQPEPPHEPKPVDFVIAIGYMLFGAVAMCAGLVSIFEEEEAAR
jgi:hypothetical protein